MEQGKIDKFLTAPEGKRKKLTLVSIISSGEQRILEMDPSDI
jgi:hypothetical protein